MKNVLTILLSALIIVIISVFGAILYIKLVASTISETSLYRQTIAYGFVIFTLILSGIFVALKYIDIYKEKHLDSYLGKSELLRIIHNEIKRYNGDELMMLSNEKNILVILSELSDLYKIAKLHYKRKMRTKPSGIEPIREIDFDSIIRTLEGKINNPQLEDNNEKGVSQT